MTDSVALPGSFRDPAGFVFRREGRLLRQVNHACRPDYDRLIGSGLYDELADAGLMVAHREVEEEPHDPGLAYRVLAPEAVPFISYPYEWCFGQLSAAALLTIDVQRRALQRSMSLKDASAFNVQFRGSRPVFIDTLSFESCKEGEPWVAYRQFCQHFLAPLALMAKVDVRLGRLLQTDLDGVELDLAARLLPARCRLSPGLLLHVFLHARAKKTYDPKAERPKARVFSRGAFLGLLDSLEGAIRGLRWTPEGTEWADYYSDTNYSPEARGQKERIVGEFLDIARPETAWDLGANTGEFSRLASARGISTVAFDIDPAAVERNFRRASADREERLLPLRTDLTNPSPALGWDNRERMSLTERGPADLILALALVHHLAIGANLPLPRVAEFLRRAGRRLVIEFVPKSDSQVGRLLVVREDIFPDYTREGFEASFAEHFEIERAEPIRGSERILYLMRSR